MSIPKVNVSLSFQFQPCKNKSTPNSVSNIQYLLKCHVCCLVPKSCLTLLWPYGPLPPRLFCLQDFPGKNARVGCYFFFQGIFPTQGSNWGLICLIPVLLLVVWKIFAKKKKQNKKELCSFLCRYCAVWVWFSACAEAKRTCQWWLPLFPPFYKHLFLDYT